jgi:hypothetical protein
MAIDYDQVGQDLRTLIEDNVSGFASVFLETDERDMHFGNMNGLCDIVLRSSEPEVRVGQSYYTITTFVVRISVFDLSSRGEAVTLRNDLLRLTQDAIRANANFASSIETSWLGSVRFQEAEEAEDNAYVAGVEFDVMVSTFDD